MATLTMVDSLMPNTEHFLITTSLTSQPSRHCRKEVFWVWQTSLTKIQITSCNMISRFVIWKTFRKIDIFHESWYFSHQFYILLDIAYHGYSFDSISKFDQIFWSNGWNDWSFEQLNLSRWEANGCKIFKKIEINFHEYFRTSLIF